MVQKSKNSKLAKFYELVSEKLIDDISDEIFSREEKREFRRIKTKSEKINYMVKNELRHKNFIKNLNDSYNQGEEYKQYLDIKNFISEIKSEDIVTARVIYIIYKYMVDNEVDKEKFKEFIDSEEFDNISNGHISEIMKTKLNNENKDIDIDEIKKEVKDMKKYVCFIEARESTNYSNSFSYYLYPQFLIENERLVSIGNPQSEFPNFGNVFLDDPGRSFSRILKECSLENELCVVEFNLEELEENIVDGIQKNTNFKIDSRLLVSENRISSINSNFIYKVAYSNDSNKALNFDEINIISKNDKIGIGDVVYQRQGDLLYGPFTVDIRSYDNMIYIKPLNTDYVINEHSSESYDNIRIISCGKEERADIVYIYRPNEFNWIDVMPEKKILEQLETYLKSTNIMDKNELDKFSNHLKQASKMDMMKGLDTNVLEKRFDRINNIFKDTLRWEEKIDELSKIINSLIMNKAKEENFNGFVNEILSDSELSRNLQKVKLVQKKVEDNNFELEELTRKIEISKLENDKLEQSIKENKIENESQINSMNYEEIKDKQEELRRLENEIDAIYKKKEEYKKSIEELKIKYRLVYDYVDMNKRIEENKDILKRQEEDKSYYKRRNDEWKSQIDSFDKKLNEKIQSASDKMNDINIDGMIANKLLRESTDWENDNVKTKFMEIAKHNNDMEHEGLDKEDLKEYIYQKIREKRNYDRNEIYNIMICITQGFLTVFAGDPGVGKTSICNIIGDVLGLNTIGENCNYKLDEINLNRYVPISVERGWTSKRDFIGYFNPLTKKFDKNNEKLFNCFNILNIEGEHSKFPFLILLDEANLSPMEYYWADFMNVCDDIDESPHRNINLGENYIFSIPKTLRFLATINYDHTTEVFSPRLIDRSWIIKLTNDNKPYQCEVNNCHNQNRIISWSDIENAFSYKNYSETIIDSEIEEVLELIYGLFSKYNSPVGIRMKNNIENYLLVGQKIFDGNDVTNEKFIALDYAISQRVLPKINGYGEDYKTFLNELLKICDRNNMMKSKYSLHIIIEKGKSNMEYYQFFC